MAAVLTLDAGCTIRSASTNLGILFGYADPEEVLGKHLSALLCPPAFLDCLQRARTKEKHQQLPCTSCAVVGWRKDGTALSLRLAISELKVDTERFFCCLIEKRKDNARLLTVDTAGVIISCNKPVARVFGLLPKDMIGCNISAFVPKFPVAGKSGILRSHSSGRRDSDEKAVLRGLKGKCKDGKELAIRVEVTARLHHDPPLYIVRISPTEKEHQNAYIIVNRAGKITEANESVCSMFGYTDEHQLLGSSVTTLMAQPPPTMKELCERHRRPVMSPNTQRRGGLSSPGDTMRVVRAKRQDGATVYVYMEVSEFRDGGEILYLIKISPARNRRRDSLPFYEPLSVDKEPKYVGHYILQDTLIEGLYGKVKTAVHVLTQEKVVIKIIERRKVDIKRFCEIELMKHLDHPHVVHMLEVITTPEREYLVLDMIEGGELYNYLLEKGQLDEDEARFYWRQLVSAVDYMHSKKIVHRDLKLENLMLDQNRNLVVIDFGLGNFMTPGKLMKTFCGSVAYAAPEMFLCHSYLGPTADIWSMGVILYSLVLGFLPFEDPRRVVQADFIPFDDANAEDCEPMPKVSPEFQDLITKIFQKNPQDRITMEGICNHPWTNKSCATPLPCLSTPQQAQPPQPPQPQQDNNTLNTPFVVDEETMTIVDHLEAFGFDKLVIYKSIECQEFNSVTASFHLLRKKTRRHNTTTTPLTTTTTTTTTPTRKLSLTHEVHCDSHSHHHATRHTHTLTCEEKMMEAM